MQAVQVDFLKFRLSSYVTAALIFWLAILAGQSQSTDQAVTLVDSFKVRVRATPEILPDNIIASLLKGTQLPLTAQKNGWYQVGLPDGQTGWVHGDYGLLEIPRDQLEVVYDVVRIRTEPSTEAESPTRAIMGQRLHLLERVDNWYKVEIPGEGEGWIREDMVELRPAAAMSSEEELVEADPDSNSQDDNAFDETEELKAEDATGETDLVPPASESVPVPAPESAPEANNVEESFPIQQQPDLLTEVGVDWLMMSLVAAGLTLLAVGIFTWRRRMKRMRQIIKKGRTKKTDLERNLVREMEEAEGKLETLDKEVQNRLSNFRKASGNWSGLGAKTSEDLLKNIEELRLVIQDQQTRMDLYSELVSLQNEQIEALKKENSSVKKLLDLKTGD